ncbi:uncharacterized protein EDB93DRAFT_1256610 [Suillus bovinus]|uniref:uncharacterized protein n=1 Tax=Suillus bovinus TaxID=48563 RepID=UPI001B8863BC|nr:uncharacterized protein EDB93DRAFT_1256610 [Suillus bovinus]KAG2128661.1 hypothetical protein EDB93DRAFT_1256610 [Suillus bovinus]
MDCTMPYSFWLQDSELYPHVKASIMEHLQTTSTDYGQLIAQPHQHFLHSVPENSPCESIPIFHQHHIACDGNSTIEGQTVGPIPIVQGDLQSHVAGQHLRHVSSNYSPAHNMSFADTNLADPWSPMQGFQHDQRNQLQKEVYPQYVVNGDKSESHIGPTFVCQWNAGRGICGRTINGARIGEHMSSYHFKSPLPADERLECLWKDCELRKPVRRDTITRHILEKHLGLRYRCKLWVASPAGAGFCQSRKNTRLR